MNRRNRFKDPKQLTIGMLVAVSDENDSQLFNVKSINGFQITLTYVVEDGSVVDGGSLDYSFLRKPTKAQLAHAAAEAKARELLGTKAYNTTQRMPLTEVRKLRIGDVLEAYYPEPVYELVIEDAARNAKYFDIKTVRLEHFTAERPGRVIRQIREPDSISTDRYKLVGRITFDPSQLAAKMVPVITPKASVALLGRDDAMYR